MFSKSSFVCLLVATIAIVIAKKELRGRRGRSALIEDSRDRNLNFYFANETGREESGSFLDGKGKGKGGYGYKGYEGEDDDDDDGDDDDDDDNGDDDDDDDGGKGKGKGKGKGGYSGDGGDGGDGAYAKKGKGGGKKGKKAFSLTTFEEEGFGFNINPPKEEAGI